LVERYPYRPGIKIAFQHTTIVALRLRVEK
jgi:hypothetical protein